MFIQNTAYVNLLLFLECASRLEHVGLNKYFWHIYKVTITCFTTRHIQGGWGQHFSTLRAPKWMTHWAPRVFDLLDTPLRWIISLNCFYFERCFFWSLRFFCNVGEMKWSFEEKHLEIFNMSEYQPALTCSLRFQFGRDVTAHFTGQMLDVLSSLSVNL